MGIDLSYKKSRYKYRITKSYKYINNKERVSNIKSSAYIKVKSEKSNIKRFRDGKYTECVEPVWCCVDFKFFEC